MIMSGHEQTTTLKGGTQDKEGGWESSPQNFWGIWGNEEGAGINRDEIWEAWTRWQSSSSKEKINWEGKMDLRAIWAV